jgi:hypothetical protein
LQQCNLRGNSLKSAWEEESINSTAFNEWADWKLETHSFNGKDGSEHKESYPKAQLSGGRPWGMTFIVKQSVGNTVCPQFDGKGARVKTKNQTITF